MLSSNKQSLIVVNAKKQNGKILGQTKLREIFSFRERKGLIRQDPFVLNICIKLYLPLVDYYCFWLTLDNPLEI